MTTTAPVVPVPPNDTFSPIVSGEDADPDWFPALRNFSAADFWTFLPCPQTSMPPEYVEVQLPARSVRKAQHVRDAHVRLEVFCVEWNLAWQAQHIRYDLMHDRVPPELAWLNECEQTNITFAPRIGRHRYWSYAPLYHLLPKRILDRHGLPALKAGIWPTTLALDYVHQVLPTDFDARFSRAVAEQFWPHLSGGRPLSSFAGSEPLRLLAHNLDFWLPHADRVATDRLRARGPVPFDDAKPDQAERLRELKLQMPPGVDVDRPYYGGSIWMGEDEAAEATREVVESADQRGSLRALIDAVQSNRVEEDFSPRWSFAREDFERKLYKKRSKLQVRFVELTDTIAVHCPESEVHENLIFEDFFGLLDEKARTIVVCLRSGTTNLSEIASKLGYANHSAVSKALGRIRQQARRFISE